MTRWSATPELAAVHAVRAQLGVMERQRLFMDVRRRARVTGQSERWVTGWGHGERSPLSCSAWESCVC